MNKWTLSLTVATILMMVMAMPTQAANTTTPEREASDSIWLGGYGNFSRWRAISRDEVILWASPSKPYLVKMWRPVTSLRLAQAIGVTTTAGRVTKFDRVIVDGERLPIKSIVALDRETAKNWRWGE